MISLRSHSWKLVTHFAQKSLLSRAAQYGENINKESKKKAKIMLRLTDLQYDPQLVIMITFEKQFSFSL